MSNEGYEPRRRPPSRWWICGSLPNSDRGEIDGTGIAAIVQRSLALECVAPCIDEAMKLRVGDAWGLPNSSSSNSSSGGGVIDEGEMAVARARTVIGVAGLVTFLLAISPLEEVTRVTKR